MDLWNNKFWDSLEKGMYKLNLATKKPYDENSYYEMLKRCVETRATYHHLSKYKSVLISKNGYTEDEIEYAKELVNNMWHHQLEEREKLHGK